MTYTEKFGKDYFMYRVCIFKYIDHGFHNIPVLWLPLTDLFVNLTRVMYSCIRFSTALKL